MICMTHFAAAELFMILKVWFSSLSGLLFACPSPPGSPCATAVCCQAGRLHRPPVLKRCFRRRDSYGRLPRNLLLHSPHGVCSPKANSLSARLRQQGWGRAPRCLGKEKKRGPRRMLAPRVLLKPAWPGSSLPSLGSGEGNPGVL